ncbi:coiled-coil domain-containing protein [Candidatus Laterigemmans baculatus]|uniref:hypothetical protein n=1 Tax=Candidatus Laterigemmans baculatus TaxID=2770505 RepID=UPI0013DA9147|nr:hypothetical protein [Candidatus Laterigemmans baculatus]
MDTIRHKIAAARRRLLLQRFGRVASWTFFVLLALAAIGAAVPKVWPLAVPSETWWWMWTAGGSAAAVLIAAGITFFTRPTLAQTALEIDRRFGLKERLSSSLALDDEARETEMGQALVGDAEQRASQLEIGEHFAIVPHRRGLLPLVPLVFLGVLIFVPDATRKNVADAGVDAAAKAEAEQIKKAAETLKKRLEQHRRQAAAEGLKDAEETFKKLEQQAGKIADHKAPDKKETLIALNDLKKQLQERRDALGSPEQMRKSLAPMKNLEQGPADRAARALAEGDFAEAKQQIEALAQKLRDGSLSKEAKQQLAEQIEQLEKKIQQAAAEHQQAKQQLEEQIEQARREGRTADAAKMQQKLNELQQMDPTMQQLQQMAEGMQAAQQALENGNEQEASEALEQIADELGQMQAEMDELEDLQDAMDQLSQTKEQMACKQCSGAGCAECQGAGSQSKLGQRSGRGGLKPGNQPGRGPANQDDSQADTNSYESQVRGEPKSGRAIIAGPAGGANRKGQTREDVQTAVVEALSEESDPLTNEPLPRDEREHAQQYFDRLRDAGL